MAWLTGWNYRKLLKTDHNKIDSDCSDFPVKVIFDKDNFAFAHALETGNDIRFTASDGETLLKHEREIHKITDWGKFAGTVDGTYDTYNDSNADYLALRFHRLGAMNKYAELDNSIDASSDFVFSFKIYVSSITLGALHYSGSTGIIGLSDNTTNANNHYVGADIVYDSDTSNKAYISSRFEGTSPNMGSGFAYSDGIELNTKTTYIIKLSKTGSTLKVAVCNASDEELWSDTATASTTPTLTYFKIWDYTPGYGDPYVDFRLSDFYNGSTEETFQLHSAVYHVKLPTASSTSDTEFYCYYGKSDATDGADGENVWDSNYKVVHHMTPDLYDSTANNHDGSNKGSKSAINRAGHYRTFNDAYVSLGSSVNFSLTDKITIEGHCKSTSDTNMRLFNRHETPSGNYGYMLSRSLTNDNAEWRISKTKADWNGGMTSERSWPINTDLHVVGTYDGSNMRVYFNGATTSGDFPASLSGNIASVAHNAYIGAGSAATNKWYGNIYEFRLSNIARSDAWIKATYASLADTLLTYGAEEALTPTARPRVMVVWA